MNDADLANQLEQFMWNALTYYWIAASGYRLHPWDSPYLRWRLETFLGGESADLNRKQFLQILWKHRHQMQSFADWAAERRHFQSRLRVPPA